MAFLNKNLGVLCYCQGFTLWQYKSTSDSLEQIEWAGYFDKIMTLMAHGDIIIINARDGTAIRAVTELSPSVIIGPLN